MLNNNFWDSVCPVVTVSVPLAQYCKNQNQNVEKCHWHRASHPTALRTKPVV